MQITAEIKTWSIIKEDGFDLLIGFIYDHHSQLYADGTKVSFRVRSKSEYADHFIVKTDASTLLLMKTEEFKKDANVG